MIFKMCLLKLFFSFSKHVFMMKCSMREEGLGPEGLLWDKVQPLRTPETQKVTWPGLFCPLGLP